MNKKKVLCILSIAFIGLFIVALIMFGCYNQSVNAGAEDIPVTDTEKDTDAGTETENVVLDNTITSTEEKVYTMPKLLSFRASTLAAAVRSGGTVDVKVKASVSPYNATHPEVDFSVEWGNAPTHGSNPVTDYVTVTQDADGSANATISCKKSFDDDKIIVTVTTRDGGYTDTCTVSFIGIASELELSSTTASSTYSEARGIYYELGTNKSHKFNIELDNIFSDVGASNCTVTLSGSGYLYFGTFVDSYDAFSWSFTNMKKVAMSDMVKELVGASVNGNVLTITVRDNDIESYYSSQSDNGSSMYTYDKYVYDDYCYCSGEWKENATYNEEWIDKVYFTATVTDNVSGVSDTIRFWVVTSVNGVTINQDEVTI